MGQLLMFPLELIHPCSWILGLSREKGKELLPYKGGVYFCTPAVSSCSTAGASSALRTVAELMEGFGQGSTQVCVTDGQQQFAGALRGSSWAEWAALFNPSKALSQLLLLPGRTKQGNPLGGETDRLPLKPWVLPAALGGGWRCY